jgi:D-arabinose 1-dehydrogenase-like Zn-dependent alcohol dehydrogenase
VRHAILPGLVCGGGYGRYSWVPFAGANLVRLPGPSVRRPPAWAATTSFHGIVDQAQFRPGEWVAVHGCGGIG